MDQQYNLNKPMDSLAQLHHILVIEDPSFEREILLDGATYSIGRHSSNDIVLSCQKTSRNHATLLRRTDVKTSKYSYWILDGDLQGNRSRNGIYINGKKSLVHELKQGDVIQFSGDAQARYKISSNLTDRSSTSDYNHDSSTRNHDSSTRLQVSKNTLTNKETIIISPSEAIISSKSSEYSHQTSIAELTFQPIIEIDLSGNITFINSAGLIHFKDIYHQQLNHPLFDNLISQFQNQDKNVITREIEINGKTFLQNAHYLPEKKAIISFIADLSQQKDLEAQFKDKTAIYNSIVQQIS